MKKIILRINLPHLRNETWFNFFLEFKKFVQKTTPEVLDIESLFAEFSGLLDKADIMLEQIRKSALTDVIVQLDGVRDNAFRRLKSSWKAALFNPDAEKRAAAEALDLIFNHYGNVTEKPYNQETATIVNLVQDLRGKYEPYIAAIGLTDTVDALDRANSDFETVVMQRNAETAEKPDLKLSEIRHETNRCYMDIVEKIEAKVLLNGMNEAVESFIKTLNANITRYR